MSQPHILLVDDDAFFCEVASDHLRRDGLDVRTAGDVRTAERKLDEQIGLLVVDQRLPDGHGLTLVQALRDRGHPARALVVTAHPEVGDAVDALRLGIDDYLTKPVDLETLRLSVLRSLEMVKLEKANRLVQRERAAERTRLVGDGLAAVRRLVTLAAGTSGTVLITGATGTGKTLAATAIHDQGDPDRPFVKVNCAAIPETLVEAELFGVEKGAYTGAGASREGLFELANGGTLFLDEIGELDLGIQAKLLGVLEDGAARRVGGTRDRRFSVRVIAATNVDVAQALAQGRFRQDLYFRLNVVAIDVPPLRARLDDLPALTETLMATLPNGRHAQLAPGEASRMRAYAWPGNVRELRNVLERSLLIDPVDQLAPSRLLPAQGAQPGDATGDPSGAHKTLAEVEMAHIHRVVAACEGNRTRAAGILGIGLATLRRRLNR